MMVITYSGKPHSYMEIMLSSKVMGGVSHMLGTASVQFHVCMCVCVCAPAKRLVFCPSKV